MKVVVVTYRPIDHNQHAIENLMFESLRNKKTKFSVLLSIHSPCTTFPEMEMQIGVQQSRLVKVGVLHKHVQNQQAHISLPARIVNHNF